jgi:hypothetical protein
MISLHRRSFLRVLGTATTAVVVAPILTSCGGDSPGSTEGTSSSGGENAPVAVRPASPLDLPQSRPEGWDPIAFNRTRGNAGAIPASYLDEVNAPDGEANAIGKHLPYIPPLPSGSLGVNMIAVMWGDPSKNHAAHPNAVRNESNQMQGHWYDWIEIRKATTDSALTQRSSYPEWPEPMEGRFAVYNHSDIRADNGTHTVYLVALPNDVSPGDTVRIFAHCLTHGEYVDFLTVPETTLIDWNTHAG